MAKGNEGHEVWIALNGSMPDSVGTLRDMFDGVIPPERIVAWESLVPTASMHAANHSRNAAAELLRESFLESLHADVILTASMVDGWVDSVVTSVPAHSRALQVAILFDLIPLVMPDIYLGSDGIRPWYMRKLDHLKRCDLLLGISEATRQEAMQLLDVDAAKVVNISAAVDGIFRVLPDATVASVGRKHGIERSFVMYAGGFDHRKNLASLIKAYAALSPAVRAEHQLALVGNIAPKELGELTAVREQAGLHESDVVFTGFVSDAELIKLYNACSLYIFPSTHEGFGLPALEAMSCGAVVLGSNTTSLPEVINSPEALFDPLDIADITASMHRGLTDEAFRQRAREHAARQIKGFSWEASAAKAWAAITAAAHAHRHRPEAASISTSAPVVAVLASQALDVAAIASIQARAPSHVDVYGDLNHTGFVSASFPEGWKKKALSTLESSPFHELFMQVHDDAAAAPLLLAAKGMNATLLPTGEGVTQALRELEVVDRRMLVGLIYRAKGYAALHRVAGPIAADAFADLTSHDLKYADPAWLNASHEPIPASSGRVDVRSLVDRLAAVPHIDRWDDDDLARLAMAVSRNQPRAQSQKTVFVDISHLVIEDALTGIQRVVRHIVAEMMALPPEGYRVEPVYINDDGIFRYARSYCQKRFFPELPIPDDEPVTFMSGDIFVGLDLAAHLVPYLRDTYVWMRSRGVQIHFVVYDLLPLLRPDCFDEAGLPTFRRWYEAVAELSDGIICISRTVADEFRTWLDQSMPARGRPVKIGYFHLGADLVPTAEPAMLDGAVGLDLGGRPSFLMVGTIEPRKGHAQTLDAFDILWSTGHNVNLILVGKPGWRVDELVLRLRNHPEAGRRLFWLERADDRQLIAMYHTASALLAASEGEGFGLPLIEAAQYGLPIIARDLPVFKEVAGEHAHYFSGMEPEGMASSIIAWLDLYAAGEAPASTGMPWLTWQQSARQLEGVAVHGNWYQSWTPGSYRRFGASDYRAQTSTGILRRCSRQADGSPGVLFGTPEFPVASGTYELRLHGKRHSPAGVAWVDVEAHAGSWRLESTALHGDAGYLGKLNVNVPEDVLDFRIRVMVDGAADVVFHGLELVPAHRPEVRAGAS
ncbi:hypothetical protein FHW69_000463 [Luteibacter sp. Sphag1AF]|uniref:glycosyltransferase family 4 protein n=1 Tax=Luteibacter sp. Sphag1AF TaxID=2587031 RepID=UPI00161E185B|nr:glycosyltransferase family 1 protein [Luteibacter sp. Sphag1AF]MBB3225873.1 hypothetical protein [Luteibacter sp. Sphag1AF]